MKVIGERNPPGIFEERVEPLLELSEFRRFDFHPGLFAIEAVEHADDEREDRSPAETSSGKKEGRTPGSNVGSGG